MSLGVCEKPELACEYFSNRVPQVYLGAVRDGERRRVVVTSRRETTLASRRGVTWKETLPPANRLWQTAPAPSNLPEGLREAQLQASIGGTTRALCSAPVNLLIFFSIRESAERRLDSRAVQLALVRYVFFGGKYPRIPDD